VARSLIGKRVHDKGQSTNLPGGGKASRNSSLRPEEIHEGKPQGLHKSETHVPLMRVVAL